jgi:hypothetical protein
MEPMAKKKGSQRKKPNRPAASGAKRPPNTRPLSSRPQQAPPSTTSQTRRKLEIKSAGPLLVLHRLPRWLIPVIMAVFLLLGLLIDAAWAGIFIIAIAVFLAWLLALSWPVILTGSKIFRTIVIVVVAVVGVMKLMGWT